MNPCPCGYFGHVNRPCRCSAGRIQQYRAKVSGPLLDRIDIHLDVPPIRDADLLGRTRGMDSTEVRGRVEQARGVQRERFGLDGIRTNAEMTPGQIERYCPLREDARAILRLLLQELHLSARSFHRVLRVARTIADLAGEEHIAQEHLNEAIQYRFLDRQAW
jgi:magnesium chelatase family protein